MRILALIAGVVVTLGSITARAEEVVYQKRTVVDFGQDTIGGTRTAPDSTVIEVEPKRRHPNLILVRENFRVDILQSGQGL